MHIQGPILDLVDLRKKRRLNLPKLLSCLGKLLEAHHEHSAQEVVFSSMVMKLFLLEEERVIHKVS